MSTDGGALLLREADKVLGLCGRVAACFTDYRDPSRTEHPLDALVRQRVFGLVLAYEGLTDHHVIGSDSMVALACQRSDVTGAKRPRTCGEHCLDSPATSDTRSNHAPRPGSPPNHPLTARGD